jgi:NADH dehydrogenase FAD-containing subunit
VKKTLFIFVLMAALFIMVAGCAPSTVVQVNTPVPNETTGTPAPNGQINVPGVNIQVYAPGPNPMVNTPDGHGAPATFWLGIWHGIISPVTLVLSFIYKNVQMYEVHNDGSLYNLGFFLGVFLLWAVVIGLLTGRR